MRASEILHGLAELMAGIESGSTTQQTQQPAAQVQTQTVAMAPVEVDNTDGANSTTMVPPLQQKMNLLKKAAGEDNAFDAQGELAHDGEHDELDDIKKIAGLTVMIDGPQGEIG